MTTTKTLMLTAATVLSLAAGQAFAQESPSGLPEDFWGAQNQAAARTTQPAQTAPVSGLHTFVRSQQSDNPNGIDAGAVGGGN